MQLQPPFSTYGSSIVSSSIPPPLLVFFAFLVFLVSFTSSSGFDGVSSFFFPKYSSILFLLFSTASLISIFLTTAGVVALNSNSDFS